MLASRQIRKSVAEHNLEPQVFLIETPIELFLLFLHVIHIKNSIAINLL